MVRLPTTLYANQLPQENSYEPLPEGKYIASVSKIELKDTKSGTGQYLNVQFTIVDGQFKGKSFFDKINISNQNQQAVEIGLARLNTLLGIGNINQLEDTEQLKGIIVLATIGFAKELYQGQKQNTVARLENPNQVQPTPTQSYIAQQPQAPQVNTWQKPQAQQQATWGGQPEVNQFMQVNSTLGQQPQQVTWGQQPQPQALQQATAQYLNDDVPF